MKKAFTLIELLVVIAIIAILAAILFPVFAQAKAAAKKSVSISNFKQIGLASVMYSGDADDVFPLREQTDTAGNAIPPRTSPITWREEIAPYIKNGISQVNWLTTDGSLSPRADSGMWEAPQRPKIYGVIDQHPFLGTGYASPYDGTNYGMWKPLSMTSVGAPADVILIVEKGVAPVSPYPYTGRDFVTNWWAWATTQQQLRGNVNVAEGDNTSWPSFSMPRYRQSGNSTTLAYVDGHAAAKAKGRIDWCKEINMAGMGDDWLTQPGNACAGVTQ